MACFPLSFREALISKAGGTTLSVLVACGLLTAAQAQSPASADTRTAAFISLRQALDRDDLDAAARHATELVALTEASVGATSRELVNPLTNLGTVALRRGDWTTAQVHYQRAIALVEGQQAGADPLLVRPLHGLGETLLAAGRANEAVVPLKRAVDLSRNLDGLYDESQIDIVDALIEAYVALGNLTEAEREQQFALRVAETTYGKRDLRLLDPLDRYARWFEFVGRYTTARGIHARALQIAEQAPPENASFGIPALRGLARTWLFEALYGPEIEPDPTSSLSEPPGSIMGTGLGNRLSADGERALRMALEVIAQRSPIDQRLQGEIQAQLGDWYLVLGNSTRTARLYRDAWTSLTAAGPEARALLDAPRLLYYRPPPISTRRLRPDDPSLYVERRVAFSLRIDRGGRVAEATIASTDAPEAVQRSALGAVKRARYAPRVVDGEAVETEGVMLVETLLVRVASSEAAD